MSYLSKPLEIFTETPLTFTVLSTDGFLLWKLDNNSEISELPGREPS